MKICLCPPLVAFLLLVALLLDLVAPRAAPPGLCSDDDTEITDCPFPPCSQAACPGRPEAVCLDDSCNDCQARFFVNGAEVHDCDPKPCPAGVEQATCLKDPCSVSKCSKYPQGTTCINDRCGGCHAVFYRKGVRVEDCDSACSLAPVNQCQLDERVTCIINPCDTMMTDCDHIKDSICVADYCHGCRGRWFLANCTEVTDRCQHERH